MPEKLNKQLSILNVLYVQNFEWFSFGWLQVMFLLLLTILKTTLSASKHLQLWIKALNCIKSFKVQNCSTGGVKIVNKPRPKIHSIFLEKNFTFCYIFCSLSVSQFFARYSHVNIRPACSRNGAHTRTKIKPKAKRGKFCFSPKANFYWRDFSVKAACKALLLIHL